MRSAGMSNELLAYFAQRGDAAAREALCRRLYPLVLNMANQRFGAIKTLPVEDLAQEGMLGVIESLSRWEAGRGTMFWTFSQRRVLGSMQDALRNKSNLIKIPRLAFSQGETLSVAQMPHVKNDAGDDVQRQDLAAIEDPPPPLENLKPWLRGLSQAERIIVLCYYVEGMTMKAIGRQLGLSESRISQMHTDILTRLRREHVTR